jgi:hypothetical protein
MASTHSKLTIHPWLDTPIYNRIRYPQWKIYLYNAAQKMYTSSDLTSAYCIVVRNADWDVHPCQATNSRGHTTSSSYPRPPRSCYARFLHAHGYRYTNAHIIPYKWIYAHMSILIYDVTVIHDNINYTFICIVYYQSYCTVLYEHRLYSFIGPISSGDKSKSINLRFNLVLSISSCGVILI